VRRLTEEQSRALLERYGAFVTEVCDKCGKILAPSASLEQKVIPNLRIQVERGIAQRR
jgi:hypothetical protein